MKTLFNEPLSKKVPKSTHESLRPDSVSENLWKWAGIIEKWGVVFYLILCVFGIMMSVFDGVTTYQEVAAIASEDDAVAATIPVIMKSLLTYELYALIELVACRIISLLLGAMAKIVQNTNITANLALLNNPKAANDSVKKTSTTSYTPNTAKTKTATAVKNTSPKKSNLTIDEKMDIYDKEWKKSKAIDSYNNISEQSEAINDLTFIDVICPNCKETVSFPQGTSNAACPWCNTMLKL